MTEWAQGTGRCGRDGKPSVCIAWALATPLGSEVEEETWAGKQVMAKMLRSSECIRSASSGFLDGNAEDCNTLALRYPDVKKCSRCTPIPDRHNTPFQWDGPIDFAQVVVLYVSLILSLHQCV